MYRNKSHIKGIHQAAKMSLIFVPVFPSAFNPFYVVSSMSKNENGA
jgi:hypothetical protein